MVVRHQIKNVFFKVGPRAANRVDFALADQFRKGNAEFRRAHRPGQGHEHGSALFEVAAVAVCGVFERRCVEVPEVALNEGRNWACRRLSWIHSWVAG